jgi:hypothetical protein
MRKLSLLVLGFFIINLGAFAQQITVGEYFFDTDPGQGNGTAFSFVASDSVNTTTSIDVSSLSPGYHNLGIRTKNSNSIWSHYEMRMFYIIEPQEPVTVQPALQKGEFFFDTDPGQGNGTEFSFASTDSLNMVVNVPISSLNAGYHNLFMRTRNSSGIWSHYEGRLFYIIEPEEAPAIQPSLISGEYFVDTDPGLGNGTAFSFASSDSINMGLNISLNGLSTGLHDVFLRTLNADGVWSHYEGREFEIICSPDFQGSASIALASGNTAICAGHNNTFEAILLTGGTTHEYEWQLNGAIVSAEPTYSASTNLQSGDDLTLSVITSDGCDGLNPARDTLEVMVVDTLFTLEDVTICQGSSYMLPDGTSVSVGGEYISYLAAVNACDSVVTSNITVEICSGLNSLQSTNFQLFPNPNNGAFSLEGSSANYTIEIRNALGQLLHFQQAIQNSTQLNIQEQPSGIYYISVIDNEEVSRFKMIKN